MPHSGDSGVVCASSVQYTERSCMQIVEGACAISGAIIVRFCCACRDITQSSTIETYELSFTYSVHVIVTVSFDYGCEA